MPFRGRVSGLRCDPVHGHGAQFAALDLHAVGRRERVELQALGVARAWSPPGAPESWRLTAALFNAIAAHDSLLDRLAELPPALLLPGHGPAFADGPQAAATQARDAGQR